ncbi:MAG: flavodoxin [Tissierellia bacterium]|nr:flavodoxin [Tissierellia bacterium]
MSKVAVVYWSGTGNTEKMAEAIVDQLKTKEVEVDLLQASEFDKSKVNDYDGFAFGCPAMGSEELEDSEFEPMFEDVENELSSKPTMIFGSYEWADGEWIETWQERCEDDGINLVDDGVKAYDDPDDEALEKVRNVADKLAEAL